MKHPAAIAPILFCLFVLAWASDAIAQEDYIEVHRMGDASTEAIRRPRRIVPRRIPKWRILERVAIEEWTDLVPVEDEEIPVEPVPEEEADTPEEQTDYTDPFYTDGTGWGGPLPQAQVPEPATMLLAGLGLAALLLRRRKR